MILNDNFYKIHNITRDGNSATINVELLPTHPIYKGHFPGQPVVPGVCTLTIIKECIAKVLGYSVSYAGIKECKYMSALIPEEKLYITISITIDEVKNGSITSIVLKSSTTNDFTAGTTIETKSAVAAGEVVFTIPSPQNNLHYQLDFTLNNTTPNSKKGTNGVATVSKVVYTNN